MLDIFEALLQHEFFVLESFDLVLVLELVELLLVDELELVFVFFVELVLQELYLVFEENIL